LGGGRAAKKRTRLPKKKERPPPKKKEWTPLRTAGYARPRRTSGQHREKGKERKFSLTRWEVSKVCSSAFATGCGKKWGRPGKRKAVVPGLDSLRGKNGLKPGFVGNRR